jgi:3-deoxy-manno-octulosonate cytidylyltransferase (CMP-KDO synthetase)
MSAMITPVVVGVVPARYGSSRWPGKALAEVAGQPLVMWAWQAVSAVWEVDRCIVPTDDGRIARWAVLSGIPFAMTSRECRNGTERIAEVAEQDDARGESADIYLNVQADQVGLEPRVISKLVVEFRTRPEWRMATLGVRRGVAAARSDPDRVLVHVIADGTAAAFWRGGPTRSEADAGAVLRHIGVYAYRREALREYAAAEPSRDELAASLEQLRALALGWKVGVVRVRSRARSYDRAEQARS